MPCTWSPAAFELMSRAVGTLLRPNQGDAEGWEDCGDADAPLAAPEWLPAPAALLELAAAETAWDVFVVGAQHPSLAAALVHAQLGQWAEAREVHRKRSASACCHPSPSHAPSPLPPLAPSVTS